MEIRDESRLLILKSIFFYSKLSLVLHTSAFAGHLGKNGHLGKKALNFSWNLYEIIILEKSTPHSSNEV